jgi:GAF domain-containing protein
VNLVLDSIIGSAGNATAAARGWILGPHPDGLVVLAAVGSEELVGTTVPAGVGTAGYVFASGQPVATMPRRDDPAAREGMMARFDEPATSVLCVPCAHGDDVLAIVELVDKLGGGGFTFDDIEIVTMLADIVGAVLRSGIAEIDPPPPEELYAGLRQLASSDAGSYARVANIFDALLARD